MIRILDSSDRRRVAALLDRRPKRDPAIERRVAQIVERVRHGGDRALLAYARTLDHLDGDIEVTRAEMEAPAPQWGPGERRGKRRPLRSTVKSARRSGWPLGTSGTWRGCRYPAPGRRG